MAHRVTKLQPFNIDYDCDEDNCNGTVYPASDLKLEERCGDILSIRHNCNVCNASYRFKYLLPYAVWLSEGAEPSKELILDIGPLEL